MTGAAVVWSRRQAVIALLAMAAIAVHLVLRYAIGTGETAWKLPLWIALALGGGPLVVDLLIKLARQQFGSDLLAGISIVTSVILGEYLAGTLVVLMLSGGETLEAYAIRGASSVLDALARRMPSTAHVRRDGAVRDLALDQVAVGDTVEIFPHEICPVDGTVLEGHSVMDESYLTGEPYMMPKAPGSAVLSGAINGDDALTIRADKLAVDSRYAKIMEVMRESERHRPRLRRLGDQLGAIYTPVAVALAIAAWAISGEAIRFLAVLVVATPCPLLIAIPVAIIGSISLSAKRAIVIRNPIVLERIDACRALIFDKTGTLTYGKPEVTEVVTGPGFDEVGVLSSVASLERYSKHPLAAATIRAAEQRGAALHEARNVSERPGEGLRGTVDGTNVLITGRGKLPGIAPEAIELLPPVAGGLECVVLIDGTYAATIRFRDQPRRESASFIRHLRPKHRFDRILLVSGDRDSEVRYLAEQVGIEDIHAGMSPEEKVDIVRAETRRHGTIFVGDGINDAPALAVATVGVAFGTNSDVTTEAAGAVIMDSSLRRVDELLHIGMRMRRIALQSAVGGMALSVIGMLVAAAGYLPPVAGAIAQEIIDVAAVANALRVAIPPRSLTDY